MKVAEFWLDAARIAELQADVARASARRLDDIWRSDVEEAAAARLDDLADAFRQMANIEQRVIDFDDRVTPVVQDLAAGELVDDEDTDPDAR